MAVFTLIALVLAVVGILPWLHAVLIFFILWGIVIAFHRHLLFASLLGAALDVMSPAPAGTYTLLLLMLAGWILCLKVFFRTRYLWGDAIIAVGGFVLGEAFYFFWLAFWEKIPLMNLWQERFWEIEGALFLFSIAVTYLALKLWYQNGYLENSAYVV